MGLRPQDFYDLDPRRFWWLVETLRPEGSQPGSGLTESDKDELLAMLKEAKEKEND